MPTPAGAKLRSKQSDGIEGTGKAEGEVSGTVTEESRDEVSGGASGITDGEVSGTVTDESRNEASGGASGITDGKALEDRRGQSGF